MVIACDGPLQVCGAEPEAETAVTPPAWSCWMLVRRPRSPCIPSTASCASEIDPHMPA